MRTPEEIIGKDALTQLAFEGYEVRPIQSAVSMSRTGPVCCMRCEDEQQPGLFRRFVGCQECGNKRCPKASDHRHTCTRSNEPGQPGSRY